MSETAITGVVSTGEGAAASFTSIEWVRDGLLELVGIDPWPGTFNLTLDSVERRDQLLQRPGVTELPGRDGACAAKVLPVTVGADRPLPAAVILPAVNTYPENKLELIAAIPLREALTTADGERVAVRPADTLDIEAAIFDLDGTLVDSLEAYFQVAKEAAANHGEQITRDFVRGTLDANNHAFWELVFTEDVANRDEVISQVKFAARERWPAIQNQYLTHLPGVADTLRGLHSRGIKLGIVTAGSGSTMSPLVEDDVARLFSAVVTKSDVDAPKPDPQGLQLALERMGVDPRRTIYVGDSQVDIQTARAAGIPGVAVLSGAGTAGTLAPQSPVRMLRSVADFHRLL